MDLHPKGKTSTEVAAASVLYVASAAGITVAKCNDFDASHKYKVAAEFNKVLDNVNYKFLRSRKEAAEQSANACMKRFESLCALHTLFRI